MQRKRQNKPLDCYHCHFVFDAERRQALADGSWDRRRIWRWPPPRRIGLELSDAAREFVAREGYDPTYGARPLKRTIQKELETAIAKGILRGEFIDGCVIFADVENERLTFKKLSGDLISVGT